LGVERKGIRSKSVQKEIRKEKKGQHPHEKYGER